MASSVHNQEIDSLRAIAN